MTSHSTSEGARQLSRQHLEKVLYIGLVLLAACSTSPRYAVAPEQLGDAAYVRGLWKSDGLFQDWLSISVVAVDGVQVARPVLRKSEADLRPIASGSHRLVLDISGWEDNISYFAPIALDIVLLPRTNYALKGQIAVDKVVVWIEKEDNAEPVVAPIAVQRYQQRPSAPLFIPIFAPK